MINTWKDKFKDFRESEDWNNIKEELQKRDNRGLTILPYSKSLINKTYNKDLKNNIFRAFEECDYDKCKVIILGNAPYDNIIGKNPVADGLFLSCSNTNKEQPSLKYWYNGLKDEYDTTLLRNPNLQFLANQGVLLLNCTLTCQPNMSEIHIKLWKPFIEYFFTHIVKDMDDLHIVLYGKQAQYYKRFIQIKDETTLPYPNTHWVYEDKDPLQYAKMRKNIPCSIYRTISDKTGIYFDLKLK